MVRLNKMQAKAVADFLTDGVGVRIVDGALVLTADGEELTLWGDGSIVYTQTWGSTHYWDRWVIYHDGGIEYDGTVPGHRAPPAWLLELCGGRA